MNDGSPWESNPHLTQQALAIQNAKFPDTVYFPQPTTDRSPGWVNIKPVLFGLLPFQVAFHPFIIQGDDFFPKCLYLILKATCFSPDVGNKKMKTYYGKYLIVIFAILCVSGSASADSAFRCGTQLVSLEDSRDEVIQRCGEPTSVDSWEEERIQRDFRSYRDYDPRTGRYEWYREPFFVKVKVNNRVMDLQSGINPINPISEIQERDYEGNNNWW